MRQSLWFWIKWLLITLVVIFALFLGSIRMTDEEHDCILFKICPEETK